MSTQHRPYRYKDGCPLSEESSKVIEREGREYKAVYDHNANGLLLEILEELKTINSHLSLITEEEKPR